MFSGATLVEIIGENVSALLPVRIIRNYQGGVRFGPRGTAECLGPGWWFQCPGLWSIEVVSAPEDGEGTNLLTQTVTTRDGKTVSFSGNMQFRITNVMQAYTQVEDYRNKLSCEAMGFLSRAVRSHTFAELLAQQTTIETDLVREMNVKTAPWGIEILDVVLTDLVITRPYRIYGDVPAVQGNQVSR